MIEIRSKLYYTISVIAGERTSEQVQSTIVVYLE